MKVFQKNNNNLTINFENSDNEIEVTEFENEPIILVNGESVSGSTKGMTKFTSEDTIYVEDEWIAIEDDLLPEGGFSSNITVVFDGVEYPNIPKVTYHGEEPSSTYGAPYDDDNFDYSVYPFSIEFWGDSERYIDTKTPGNHTISITGFVGGKAHTDSESITIEVDAQFTGQDGWAYSGFISDMETEDMLNLGEKLINDITSARNIGVKVYSPEGSSTYCCFSPSNTFSALSSIDTRAVLQYNIGLPYNGIVCSGVLQLIYIPFTGWEASINDVY